MDLNVREQVGLSAEVTKQYIDLRVSELADQLIRQQVTVNKAENGTVTIQANGETFSVASPDQIPQLHNLIIGDYIYNGSEDVVIQTYKGDIR